MNAMRHDKLLARPGRRLASLTALALATLLSACANLAPDYQRSAAPLPAQWPASAAMASAGTPASDMGWRDFVQDPRLAGTITRALQGNRSLRATVLAVQQSAAALQIQEAAQWPTVNGTAGVSASRTPAEASSTGRVVNARTTSAGLGVSAFELDLFGRVRNLKDAALESYLASDEARRSAQLALVAQVAAAWLQLAADQTQLALARLTLQSQQRSYALVQQRNALGADSGLTLAQAQTSYESARLDAAAFEAQVQQDRNALDLLVGSAVPDDLLPQGLPDVAATLLVAVPGGVPADTLRNRPDVLAAEHTLIGAHADIGAARAALYPSITLTTSIGTASSSLTDLFKGGAWSLAPSLKLPLLDGGAGRATVRSKEIARDAQLANYEQVLQTAFREVADALAVRASLAERLDAQAALVNASERSLALAQARQTAGSSSFLDVLDAQRTLVAARQGQVSLRLAEQSNRITLFKALGGGWQGDDGAAPAATGNAVPAATGGATPVARG